ncbi:MAG TPA: type II toxin-antitoxin system RelE/ParE family toxin [Tepidisphaeraceae bacterium]|nr:type II toxin-antitoxin system RelE/ParE family toxin [Tepidisphaeraceae bacterium]
MTLTIAQTATFDRQWRALDLVDEDLRALEVQILLAPDAAPVVRGTGGVRKARFARPGGGKSGGVRVCYAWFPSHATVFLLLAFAKNAQANLTDAERGACRSVITRISAALDAATRRTHG